MNYHQLAPKAEPTIEAPTEAKPIEPLKNNSKTQARNEKKITCPKCAKTLTLKSYRYSHERNCQGPLETKPIKPKPKAVPIAKPQKVEYHEVAHHEENQQPQQQHTTPKKNATTTACKPATKYSTALPIIAK